MMLVSKIRRRRPSERMRVSSLLDALLHATHDLLQTISDISAKQGCYKSPLKLRNWSHTGRIKGSEIAPSTTASASPVRTARYSNATSLFPSKPFTLRLSSSTVL